jgi:hypothetical protein
LRQFTETCIPSNNLRYQHLPFSMAYKPIELLFLPLLFSACFYIADLWLLFNLPFGTTPQSIFIEAFLVIALAAPLIGLWAISRHGAFVVGADNKGIYYKKLDNDTQFFFIDWNCVHNITIKETGKRTLIIETTMNKFKKEHLPIPCNGNIFFLEPGNICLEFNTCFSYKSINILKNLNGLRRRYFSQTVQSTIT